MWDRRFSVSELLIITSTGCSSVLTVDAFISWWSYGLVLRVRHIGTVLIIPGSGKWREAF